MAHSSTSMLQRERYLILGLLLALATIAWVLLIWQSTMISTTQTTGMGSMAGITTGLTMGMSAIVFIAIWIVMMIAMMFPTSAPMILMFNKIYASKREKEQPFVPTWIFVSAYLLVWSLCGVLAYPLAAGIDKLAAQSMWLMENAARIGGAVLLLAGLYQLSPLKNVCLSKCRTPLQFILSSWHDGYGGAFRMGLEHGIYCLGCCWLLFVILFPLGIMNIAVMALVTALIYAEKSLPFGRKIGLFAGVGLIIYGTLSIFLPAALPMGM